MPHGFRSVSDNGISTAAASTGCAPSHSAIVGTGPGSGSPGLSDNGRVHCGGPFSGTSTAEVRTPSTTSALPSPSSRIVTAVTTLARPWRNTHASMRNGPTCVTGRLRAERFVDTTQPSGSAANPPQRPPTLSSIVSNAPARRPPDGPRR